MAGLCISIRRMRLVLSSTYSKTTNPFFDADPDVIVRGIATFDTNRLNKNLLKDFKHVLMNKKGRVVNWIYIRKLLGEIAERRIFKELRRRPLVLPVVIEV